MSDGSPGKIAYQAYSDYWASHKPVPAKMPPWHRLPAATQRSWEAVGSAVVEAIKRGDT